MACMPPHAKQYSLLTHWDLILAELSLLTRISAGVTALVKP